MAFAGPPLKLSERVARPTPLATAPIEQMLTSLNLGVQKSLDPDANNLVAAGTFVYGSLQFACQGNVLKVCAVPLLSDLSKRLFQTYRSAHIWNEV